MQMYSDILLVSNWPGCRRVLKNGVKVVPWPKAVLGSDW